MQNKLSALKDQAKKRAAQLGLVGAAAAGFASTASAAVDVTDVVAEIGGAVTPIGAIGSAVLIVLVTAAVYKWVRRAL